MIEAFARTTDEVVSLDEFRGKLASGRRLRVKFGADVTAPFLHLGHAVNLWMMREMQERGHLVQFLIGDFTTLIGDPTGNEAARTPRSRADIERDAEAFIRQVGRILITDDPERFELRRNASWWAGKPLGDFIGMLGAVTAGKLLSRDMFKARMEAGRDIRASELVYPLLQGWDSVELQSDLTIVGSDQLFNESMGRFFQEKAGQAPQVIVTSRITPGLDGLRKQSKSLNNFVGLEDSPREAFGKVMSLPDALIRQWFEVYTTTPLTEVAELCAAMERDGLNPRDAKLRLARAIVARLHGEGAGREEEAWFLATISGKDFPADAPLLRLPPGASSILELCAKADPGRSRSELRRLIREGGVELEGARISEPADSVNLAAAASLRLRLGRRGFRRILVEGPGGGKGEAGASDDAGGPSGYGC